MDSKQALQIYQEAYARKEAGGPIKALMDINKAIPGTNVEKMIVAGAGAGAAGAGMIGHEMLENNGDKTQILRDKIRGVIESIKGGAVSAGEYMEDKAKKTYNKIDSL